MNLRRWILFLEEVNYSSYAYTVHSSNKGFIHHLIHFYNDRSSKKGIEAGGRAIRVSV